MTLAQQEPIRISVLDRYSLVVPPELKCYQDGPPGSRDVFVMDFDEQFMISFEEGMESMDLTRASCNSIVKHIESEYQSNGRYIHQLRTDPATRPGAGNYAFFYIKILDENGESHILPGQMTAKAGYKWSDGVEPVLLDIMLAITVKDGCYHVDSL